MKISDIKLHLRSIECTRHKIELEVKPYCPECEREYQKSLNGETIEERLREKSKVVLPFEQSCNTLNYTPIRFIDLDDALEITKDLFTKEQVEELLKKQREKSRMNIIAELLRSMRRDLQKRIDNF